MANERIIEKSVLDPETGCNTTELRFEYESSRDCGFSFSLFSEVGQPFQLAFAAALRDRGYNTRVVDVDGPPYVITVVRLPQERCGSCTACRCVAAARSKCKDVLQHNRLEWDQPCQTWQADAAHNCVSTADIVAWCNNQQGDAVGNTWEVWAWLATGDDYNYVLCYTGESMLRAIAAAIRCKITGVGCVKLMYALKQYNIFQQC